MICMSIFGHPQKVLKQEKFDAAKVHNYKVCVSVVQPIFIVANFIQKMFTSSLYKIFQSKIDKNFFCNVFFYNVFSPKTYWIFGPIFGPNSAFLTKNF
eukprot:TRINITY_DN52632_c0_g1_i1.p2 TRINITY_DN52632_c0_g1~~TRINITY_DN52632_c0_g1_i1.p2  ORF type:complete len:105 (-),score=0.66 TRINITY_DN52632_c0_g1_i1:13-306(-)